MKLEFLKNKYVAMLIVSIVIASIVIISQLGIFKEEQKNTYNIKSITEKIVSEIISSSDFESRDAEKYCDYVKDDSLMTLKLSDYQKICKVVNNSRRIIRGDITDSIERGQIVRNLIYLSNWKKHVSKCNTDFSPTITTNLELNAAQQEELNLYTRISLYVWSTGVVDKEELIAKLKNKYKNDSIEYNKLVKFINKQ